MAVAADAVWATEPAATYAFAWEQEMGRRFAAAIRYIYANSEEGACDGWTPSVVLRLWTYGRRGQLLLRRGLRRAVLIAGVSLE